MDTRFLETCLATFAAILAMGACSPDPHLAAAGIDDAARAETTLQVAPGEALKGTASFEEIPSGVKVIVEVAGASPPGKRGVHVHEKGNCSDIAAQSMGSHFAPRQETHGLPSFPEHHIGDLGNIEIRDDGSGRLEIVARDANLRKDDALSFRDRAIVVHERADKGKPPPSGDSGKPIACGVIQADD